MPNIYSRHKTEIVNESNSGGDKKLLIWKNLQNIYKQLICQRYNTLVHSFKFSRLCHVYKGPVCNCYSFFKNQPATIA
jgi:hypothetical protein